MRAGHKIISKPIVFGTFAVYRGKKVVETQAHAWCCYVRGTENEDISKFIKKVVFELDPSFPEPKISIENPPFEVHQVGWGQFSIGIKLFFHDPAEELKLEINLV